MAYQQKTVITDADVQSFISGIENEVKRQDCQRLVDIMTEVTGEAPKMFGSSVVGFNTYHYTYASGHSGYSCALGFSPRKANIAIYSFGALQGEPLLEALGKHKAGAGCLYINKLSDVDEEVLREFFKQRYKILADMNFEFKP